MPEDSDLFGDIEEYEVSDESWEKLRGLWNWCVVNDRRLTVEMIRLNGVRRVEVTRRHYKTGATERGRGRTLGEAVDALYQDAG